IFLYGSHCARTRSNRLRATPKCCCIEYCTHLLVSKGPERTALRVLIRNRSTDRIGIAAPDAMRSEIGGDIKSLACSAGGVEGAYQAEEVERDDLRVVDRVGGSGLVVSCAFDHYLQRRNGPAAGGRVPVRQVDVIAR